jgi:hypothetical protein
LPGQISTPHSTVHKNSNKEITLKNRFRTVIAVLIGLAVIMLASGCSSVSTDSDLVGLHYKGGSFSATKFADCVPASTRDYNGPGDKYYLYPNSQRDFDATGGEGSDAQPITVASSDNAELKVPVTLNFTLKSDCKTLQRFHEKLGNRYHAFWEDGQASSDIPDGWRVVLNKVMAKPLDATLDRIAQKYPWRSVWNDPKVKVEMEQQLTANIESLVNRKAGGEYFENFSVLIQKPDPVNAGLKSAIAQEQTSVAKARAAEAQAKADVLTANAQVEVAKAQAAKKRAEVEGYPSVDAYLKAQAIARGLNPYQPSGVLLSK